jgi:hypothetical protein
MIHHHLVHDPAAAVVAHDLEAGGRADRIRCLSLSDRAVGFV